MHQGIIDVLNGKKPKIIAITGSTRFRNEFRRAAADETLNGNIVLTVHVFRHDDYWEEVLTEEECDGLDALFQHNIQMCDELLVLNVNGYIGEGTAKDIGKALLLGKPIRFLEADLAEIRKTKDISWPKTTRTLTLPKK